MDGRRKHKMERSHQPKENEATVARIPCLKQIRPATKTFIHKNQKKKKKKYLIQSGVRNRRNRVVMFTTITVESTARFLRSSIKGVRTLNLAYRLTHKVDLGTISKIRNYVAKVTSGPHFLIFDQHCSSREVS